MKLFTSCLICFLAFSVTVSNAQIIDLGVAVFDEPNFEGKHTFFSEDQVHETSFGIESIRIPPGWIVTVFTEINFQGQRKVLKESCNLESEIKNEIRSVRIDQKIGIHAQYSNWDLKRASVKGYVTLFAGTDFNIERVRTKGDWISDGWRTVRSIHIPEGWEIWLYHNTLFEGPYLVLNASWDGHGPEKKEWKDHIESIRIVRKPVHPPLQVSGLVHPVSLSPNGSIVLFEDTDFMGEHIFVDQDWNTEHPIGVESIQIPHGLEIWAYKYHNFQGDYKRITHSWDGKNGSDDDLWKNNIRSIRIVRKPPIRIAENILPYIEIFEHAGLKGNSCTISGNWSAHNSGNQSWNNCISSIKIPSGVRVVVYESTDFTGRSIVLTAASSGTLSDFWNDQIGSIQIFCTD